MSYKPIIIDGLAFVAISLVLVFSLDRVAKLFEPIPNEASALIDQVTNQKLTHFKLEIQKPGILKKRDHKGRTPLMWVVYLNYNALKPVYEMDKKRLPFVKYLCGNPTNEKDSALSFMEWAAYKYSVFMREGLSQELDAQDSDDWTALHWAAWSGMPKCTEELVKSGADVNKREVKQFTPLMLSSMRGNLAVTKMLLANGAEKTAKNSLGQTALELAVQRRQSYAEDFAVFRDVWNSTASSIWGLFGGEFESKPAMVCDPERMRDYDKIIDLLSSADSVVPQEEPALSVAPTSSEVSTTIPKE